MNGSLKMIKLDFFTMKSQLSVYLALAAIAIMFIMMGSSLFVLAFTCSWYVALMSQTIFVIQEKNNLNRLYGSLSVKLRDIVLGRYLFVLLNFVISFIIIIALYRGFGLFQVRPFELSDICAGFSLSFLIFSAIVGIQIPIFFKMGYTKARVWSFVPFIAVIALMVIPSFVDGLSGFVDYIRSGQIIITIGALLASVVILFLSYCLSLVAYRSRR